MEELQTFEQTWTEGVNRAEYARDELNWELVKEKKRLVIYRGEDRGLTAVKMVMETSLTGWEVLDYMHTEWLDANDRLQPDMVESHEVLRRYSTGQTLWVQKLKSPFWGVSRRDLLLYESSLPNVHMSVSVACAQYPETKNYLRAELIYGAHFLEPLRQGTKVTVVSLGDPKGYIPNFLVSWKVKERGQFYTALLRDMETKYYKEEVDVVT